jgi:N-acetylglucosamine-6-phosphate deacetylase
MQGAERPEEPALSPGLVDIQLNGFAGVNFSDPGLEPETAISVMPQVWKSGVTAFCPTLITNSREMFIRNFRVLEKARAADRHFARATPCYHLEGPYLSPGMSRGIHDPIWMHAPDWDEFQAFQEAAGGHIGIVTIAPEHPGATAFIERACDAGVVVAIGHTDGTPEQIHAAVDAGARLSTHLGNGCAQTIDRHANMFWPQMTRDELSASIICDTFHLPGDLVKVILRTKGIERTILITDASHLAMLPPGFYSMVGTDLELLPNGKVIKVDGSCLGGSAIRMNQVVARFMKLSGASLEDALLASTTNPARLLNRESVCAKVEPGAPASLLLSRQAGDELEVLATWQDGEEVYREGR